MNFNPGASKMHTIEIFNMQGEIVYSLKNNANPVIEIETLHFSGGVYVFVVTNSKTNQTKIGKLLVENGQIGYSV